MDVFTMVVAIVLITTLGTAMNRWLKLNERRQGERLSASAAHVEAQSREMEALRQRVATLEAIVTDPSFDLRRKIEALRNPADA